MTNNKNNIRKLDPFLEREREQYEHPLPSREYILQILAEHGVPIEQEDLCSMLQIELDEEELFIRRLRAMERDGQIMRNRKRAICVMDKLDLVKGKVQGHPDGFGFLIPEDGSEDLVLSAKEMHKALHGDVVMARVGGTDRRGRREASIVEVLEHANTRVVGRLYEDHGILTAYLHCEWPTGGISVGGYGLDEHAGDKGEYKREGNAFGLDHLMQIMKTVGVDTWEKLAGKHVIVLFPGTPGSTWGSSAVGIANATDESLVLDFKEHAQSWKDREPS